MTHILAIDQGTTSSRAILFDKDIRPVTSDQQEFTQHFPKSGWVEHDPEEIWQSVLSTCRNTILKSRQGADDIAAIGITNQRETVVVWDRHTGAPVMNAIVWQDRRTADMCKTLREAGHEAEITERTGLLLDPYFSSTKLSYILDAVEGARARAEAGDLLFGTIDCFLIWKLTGGRSHVTDATNAARTMLFNIHSGEWDSEICALLNVPMNMLPKVLDCAADFGECDPSLFGAAIPIRGVAGDQQAATLGQACFEPGMMKSTYGTGCFALLNTGDTAVSSQNRLLTTIAYQLDGKPTYALEGSIFVAGSVVQWLRDKLQIIDRAEQSQALAEAGDDEQDVVLVPAFTGLGAPYWSAESRGAIFGLTRNSGRAELARAALRSVGFQTRDLLEAMRADWPQSQDGGMLRVDGGMVASDYAMQFLADILNAPVDRPIITETTALGAAWLAGMKSGIYPDAAEFSKSWALERRFDPVMEASERDQSYERWKRAVAACLAF